MITQPVRLLAPFLGAVSVAWSTAADIEILPSAQIPKVTPAAPAPAGLVPLQVRVLVLEFNPWIPGEVHTPDAAGARRKSLRELAGWNDPLVLAAGYLQDLAAASDGRVQIEIAEWQIVRRFQRKTDGFLYTPETYVACLRNATRYPWHDPDGVDYAHMVREFDLVRRVESGEIDEVWMMGAPYFGYWESCMIGRDAFEVNGAAYDRVPCRRRFVVMGFNYERGVAEMLEDLSHLPKAAGVGPDGRSRNWWDYLFNFNVFDTEGKALPAAKPSESGAAQATVRRPS